MDAVELRAGPDQTIVVYQPADTSSELDPPEIFTGIAHDAERRAAAGEWIISVATMPLRHAGAALGMEGSGYETKSLVIVVYGRIGPKER